MACVNIVPLMWLAKKTANLGTWIKIQGWEIIPVGGYTAEQGMVGTQRSRVWWVHRGAGYGGYIEEQGKVGVYRGAGYGRYTEEQGIVGT